MARGRGTDWIDRWSRRSSRSRSRSSPATSHLLDGVEDETVAHALPGPRRAAGRRASRSSAIDDVTFSDLERAVAVPALAARARDRRAAQGRRPPIVYDVQFTEPTTRARGPGAVPRRPPRRATSCSPPPRPTASGGTNVLGGDENVARGRRARRRPRTSRPTAAASSTASPTPPAACAASPSSPPSSPAAARCPRRRFDRRGRVDRLPRARAARSRPTRSPTSSPAAPTPSRLRGRIVVVGATAPTLQDVHSTPTAERPPDVRAGDPGQRDLDRAARPAAARRARWTGLLALLLLGAAPALAAPARARAAAAALVAARSRSPSPASCRRRSARGWIVAGHLSAARARCSAR